MSSDWLRLTGQEISNAMNQGWLDCIHPGDREVVRDIHGVATRTGAEYSVRYRLVRPDSTYRWVGAGGVPSFGMEDNRFIGFLGSITELADGATDTITAYGTVGQFRPPPPHPTTMPSDSLDMTADHLLLAHSLIEGDGGKDALPDVRRALLKIGRALAAQVADETRSLN